MHFTEYETYLYLGYNDLIPMGEKFTEYKTAKQYIDNAKLLFNNPTIILPLKNNKVIKKYVYLEKIYYVFINNLIMNYHILLIHAPSFIITYNYFIIILLFLIRL